MEASIGFIAERLIARIRQDGPLTYAAFVEAVLYDEDDGYYRAGKQEGKDFATSPEIHRSFGTTIGRYMESVCTSLHLPSATILELGGASGRLARDVLSAFTKLPIEEYVIVDRAEQRKEGKVRWIKDLAELKPFEGFLCIIANEFFDALPFHKIVRLNDELHEVYIDHKGNFVEHVGPLSAPVKTFLQRYPLFLHENQFLEVTPDLERIAEDLSRLAERAFFLVFDYGYYQTDIASGRFVNGSVMGYKDWNAREDVFSDVGKMDVTHHVNFGYLSAVLERLGWKKEGETEQHRFLLKAGIIDILSQLPEQERVAAKWLIHPDGLGSAITVLGFSRNCPLSLGAFR